MVYCNRNNCNIAYSSGFNLPNGLARGHDELIYVPSTIGGYVDIFSLGEDHTLTKLDRIKTPPIDNLNVDKNGDIYAGKHSTECNTSIHILFGVLALPRHLRLYLLPKSHTK